MGSQHADDPYLQEKINDGLAQWVAERMPVRMNARDFKGYQCIGVCRETTVLAVVVYSNFRRMAHGNSMDMSIAADNPSWCRRGVLRALFHYPFAQQGCVRVTANVGRRNKRSRRLVEGLGFKLEGMGRRAYDGRQDAAVYSLMRDECKWLR
jgi:RimJ/RimL family protein N-acetyltransferase